MEPSHININLNKDTFTIFVLYWRAVNKMIETHKDKTRTLFNKTKQYMIYIFYKIILFKYRTKQIKSTETNKKVRLLN